MAKASAACKTSAAPRRRTWLKRGILLVFAPLVFLSLLEGALHFFDVFQSSRLLLETEDKNQRVFFTNPSYGRSFLPRENMPIPSPIWVPEEKSPGVKRVLLIGESAAAGFPDPEFNLARFVQSIWNKEHPDQRVEVINLTMVAINSHILRDFVEEGLLLRPDLIVLYAGHNEAIGPYGPAAVFGQPQTSLTTIRFSRWINCTRVARLLETIAGFVAEKTGNSPASWAGLDEFMGKEIAIDDPRLVVMRRHADENFRWMMKRAISEGLPVVLSIPAVNLTDWPPPGGGNAYEVYQSGAAARTSGSLDKAWELYRESCDLDPYRFRADRIVRDNLRALALEYPGQIFLADVDADLHENNSEFVTDRDYFYEHVHLTFLGRAMAAKTIVEAMREAFGLKRVEKIAFDMADLAERMLWTDWSEQSAWASILSVLNMGVFETMPEKEDRTTLIEDLIQKKAAGFRSTWNSTNFIAKASRATNTDPSDPVLFFIAGKILMEFGVLDNARIWLDRGLEKRPNYHEAHLNLTRIMLNARDFRAAENHLKLLDIYAPTSPLIAVLWSDYYAFMGIYSEALIWLEKAARARSPDPGVFNNLGQLYMMTGRHNDAKSAFERCVIADPQNHNALNNLAWLIITSTNSTPAEQQQAYEYALKAVAIAPTIDRLRGTLAVTCAAIGRREESLKHAAGAVSSLRQSGDQPGLSALVAQLARYGVQADEFVSPRYQESK